jgi:hypothetical protein
MKRKQKWDRESYLANQQVAGAGWTWYVWVASVVLVWWPEAHEGDCGHFPISLVIEAHPTAFTRRAESEVPNSPLFII